MNASMAGLDPATQSNKHKCPRPLDGRVKPAHGEVGI